VDAHNGTPPFQYWTVLAVLDYHSPPKHHQQVVVAVVVVVPVFVIILCMSCMLVQELLDCHEFD
jgi:hypothetical protein